jgi:hypothetical protein
LGVSEPYSESNFRRFGRKGDFPLNGDEQIVVDMEVACKGKMCLLQEDVEKMQDN